MYEFYGKIFTVQTLVNELIFFHGKIFLGRVVTQFLTQKIQRKRQNACNRIFFRNYFATELEHISNIFT